MPVCHPQDSPEKSYHHCLRLWGFPRAVHKWFRTRLCPELAV